MHPAAGRSVQALSEVRNVFFPHFLCVENNMQEEGCAFKQLGNKYELRCWARDVKMSDDVFLA